MINTAIVHRYMKKIPSGCTFHNHQKIGCVRCARCIHVALDREWGLFQHDHVKTPLNLFMSLSSTKVLLATNGWKRSWQTIIFSVSEQMVLWVEKINLYKAIPTYCKCIHSMNYMIAPAGINRQLWRPNHLHSTKIRRTYYKTISGNVSQGCNLYKEPK